MKTRYFEYIAVYLSVLLVCIFIGAITRYVLLEMGADEYTARVFFWISIGFGILVFSILSLFLNDLTERLLIRFLKTNKNESSENHILVKNLGKKEWELQDDLTNLGLSENKNAGIDIERRREEQQNTAKNQKQAKIDAAIHYAQQEFALYASDEDLKLLSKNIIIYAENINVENLKPVKIKELTNLDLFHFGWNIWNCFKVSRQDRAAQFLKLTFADALKDVEVNSIKTHLKDDEQKGNIKIIEDLTRF